jgi:transcription antitermination factor NusG
MIFNRDRERQCYCKGTISEVFLAFYAFHGAKARINLFSSNLSASGSGDFTSIRKSRKTMPHLIENGEALSENAPFENHLHDGKAVPNYLRDVSIAQRWYAAYTSPRHEKRVEQHLSLRGVEHYLPIYSAPRKWKNGVKVLLDLPLFPGYIFVRINQMERVRVLEVPGVLAIVGRTASEMVALPENEVEALRSGLHLRQVEPHPHLTVGHRVRIRSGALAGMEGIVVRKKSSLRVVLTMDLIMQSVSVEVDGSELEQLHCGVPAYA